MSAYIKWFKEIGIKDVAEVHREEQKKFRRERLQELEARLSELSSRGIFDKLKGIRLAWRRGFPERVDGRGDVFAGGAGLCSDFQGVGHF